MDTVYFCISPRETVSLTLLHVHLSVRRPGHLFLRCLKVGRGVGGLTEVEVFGHMVRAYSIAL